ncbi:hypothetical protein PMAYCL1PPCAC_03603, partial [Pristionchus mayeri]
NFACIYTYPFQEKRTTFTREEIALLYQMKLIVQDNLNIFLGISYDSDEFFITWQQCFKGTLAHVLSTTKGEAHMEQKRMSNNIKGTFVKDILKGLDFLHKSDIHFHGALTPNNCLIDSHWILKLSGFGVNQILHRWRHRRIITTGDKTALIPNSELHYYAPEVRQFWMEEHQGGKDVMSPLSVAMGQKADVYSFGMVLYEILYGKKFVALEDDPSGVPLDDEFVNSNDANQLFHFDKHEKIPQLTSLPENDDVHADLSVNLIKCCDINPAVRPDLIMMRRITDSTLKVQGSLVDQMMKNLENYTNDLENLVKQRTHQLEIEQEESDNLLLELIPRSVFNDIRSGKPVEPRTFKHATILYSDIVGFTSLCSESTPMEVVKLLSGIFQAFDSIISKHDTYKVETIGDAYMVASGVPEPSKNHVRNVAQVALKNREFLEDYEIPHRPGQHLHCRWGFNSGPVATGVIGFNAPRYCIFGHTVSLAAKMESSGIPDKIQMTVKSHQLLTARFPEFKSTPRGQVKIEGLGTFLTYWLDGVEELLISDRSSYKRTIEDSERGSMERETSMVPDRPTID